ncbi:MAG: cyclic nucleotide-binding domain-containing protein [Chloroflexi bacterium]|nr:MAG: cyclic nucleotide-binding domain-containing protein [Chloroflexota bacterium]
MGLIDAVAMSIVDSLEQVPIFADLDRAQLETLAKFAQDVEVAAGAELTHEGRYEGSVYVVISGMVEIERNGRTVDTIGPANFFGEIAAIDGGPRTATVRALVESRLVVLSQVQFNEVLDASVPFREAVMPEMEQRLSRME